jgi:hypothetical protein
MKAEATEKQTIWEERVRGWHASGVSARKYAETNGFSVSTLRYWSYRMKGSSEGVRILRLVPKAARPAPDETRLAPASASAPARLTVQVGAARVVVQSGFDGRLLAEVVGALSGGSQ